MVGLIRREELKDLSTWEVDSVDLSHEYWTPETEGEQKRLYYMGISEMEVPDHNDKDTMVTLPCAVFVDGDGETEEVRTIVNASIRLRSIVERLEDKTAVQITYKGKKRNRSNGNMSDDWSVVTLREAK